VLEFLLINLFFEENTVMQKLFRKVFRHTNYYLNRELKNCRTVIDLGCGSNSPIAGMCITYSVGVDLSKICLLEAKSKGIYDECVWMDVRSLGFRFKSFDCAVALDVLEHVEKSEGFQMLEEIEKIAREKVIVQTPNGFVLQKDGSPLQIHRSGWGVDDFLKRGYTVRGMAGLKILRGERAQLRFKPKIFWAVISGITQFIVYRFSRFAYHLFSVRLPNRRKVC